MRVLDLFSGIGGFSLGLERAGMETVAFCEYDEKCRQVLKKHWPDVPQYTDVRTLTGEQLERDGIGSIDVICGGYPCQPFSVAGKRQGEADDRHLWPEFYRLVQELRPTWVIGENVAGHINMGLDSVLADLENAGYQSQVFLIPACAVGAYHRRDRIWIVAHADDDGSQDKFRTSVECKQEIAPAGRDGRTVPDADHARLQGRIFGRGAAKETQMAAPGLRENVSDPLRVRQSGQREPQQSVSPTPHENWKTSDVESISQPGIWKPEPPVGRVANGVPGRVDRLKQLGNAVVPQIPEIIGRAIMEAQ